MAEIIRRLNLALTPVASSCCDRDQTEDHYTPSRKLRHLVRARTATCDAPGCQARAASVDLDHTVLVPGRPRCRTHVTAPTKYDIW